MVEALAAQQAYSTRPIDAAAGESESDSGGGVSADWSGRLGEIDRDLDAVEAREALRPAIAALPERERAILMLRFYGNQTQTQIADHVGLSQMHVSRILARTLTQLREQLE